MCPLQRGITWTDKVPVWEHPSRTALTASVTAQTNPLHQVIQHLHMFYIVTESINLYRKSLIMLTNLKWFGELLQLNGNIVTNTRLWATQYCKHHIKTVSIRVGLHTFIKCHKTDYCIIGCRSYCFHWKQEMKCTPVLEQ